MFSIIQQTKVLFYGYPSYYWLKNVCKEFKNWGPEVRGYIDIAAKNIEKERGLDNIWTLEELPFERQQRKEMVVIILLQNGRLHEEIAEELFHSGFEKILFLPKELRLAGEKILCRKYNAFWEGDFNQLTNIPMFNERHIEEVNAEVRRSINTGEINEDGRYITRKIPVDSIFTDNCPVKYLPEKNIAEDSPYYELYEYLFGYKEDCTAYLNMTGVKDKDKAQRLLKDRKALLDHYEANWKEDSDYFYYSAPHGRWNDKGYFNIIDGHHRAIYLAYKGMQEINLRIKREDYQSWILNRKNKFAERKQLT